MISAIICAKIIDVSRRIFAKQTLKVFFGKIVSNIFLDAIGYKERLYDFHIATVCAKVHPSCKKLIVVNFPDSWADFEAGKTLVNACVERMI